MRINQWGVDNSFATDHPKDELRFGKGGVDDAEDAEVILHEYGHAIHFSQSFSFAREEAGAISEGFGDYWAADVSDIVAPTPDPACVADWDSVSYTSTVPHCLRRVDTNLHYPERPERRGPPRRADLVACALGHPRALGHAEADTMILNGQFDFPGTTMTALAQSTVAARSRSSDERGECRHRGVRGPRDPLAREGARAEVAPAHLPHDLEPKAPPDAEQVRGLALGPVHVDRDLGPRTDRHGRPPAASEPAIPTVPAA